ncbi:MAG: ribonuclease H-like domain-containing protein [Rhodospirillales bacterium]|nr:ribonuclease H-like domain-containing protein [Rhodospirillales bacterium]
MSITLHKGDLPGDIHFGKMVAVDTETLGLNPERDPLCLVQLSAGDGNAHIVQLDRANYEAPNLKALISNENALKIFHFARFDITIMKKYLEVDCTPVYCTRTASRLARTYTDRHGLRECCRELLGVELNKQQQSSDWGAEEINDAQLQYAANDVLHLHALKDKLDIMLEREDRMALAQKCFDFLPVRADLDLAGWSADDIFAHT